MRCLSSNSGWQRMALPQEQGSIAGKNFAERNFHHGILGADNLFLYLSQALRGSAYVSSPQSRIEDPNVLHAHRKVIVDPFLHLAHGISSGRNVDAQERRASQRPLAGLPGEN